MIDQHGIPTQSSLHALARSLFYGVQVTITCYRQHMDVTCKTHISVQTLDLRKYDRKRVEMNPQFIYIL